MNASAAVIYYSRSGQTRKVAEAIVEALPVAATPQPIGEAAVPEAGTLVFFGLPVERFGPARPAERYLREQLAGRRIALFVTHAAGDDIPELDGWLEACREAARECDLVGFFHCQGELSGAARQMMLRSDRNDLKAWAEADDSAGEPGEEALALAGAFARRILTEEEARP
jgi:hypothetical protein